MKKPSPLSPHLQIYRLPLTALLSITHRLTGVFLIMGMLAFTMGLLVLAYSPHHWYLIDGLSDSIVTNIFLLLVSFSLWLHWAHGLRHLFWDCGKGFELRYTRLFDSLEIIFAVLMTACLWMVHTFL